MSGHWICDSCGYDGEHADYCKYLRPVRYQWKGNRTSKEIDLAAGNYSDQDDPRTNPHPR